MGIGCAMAVLRGADVFAQGVLAAPSCECSSVIPVCNVCIIHISPLHCA